MADDSGPVFRLVYRSHLRIPSHQVKAELGAIFSRARSNNKREGITGALLVWGDHVVQTLEGEETAVRGLYDTIHRDARHEQVTILETVPETERVFGRWSMARVGDEDEPDIPLLMDRDKGGITPAQRRATTTEQDAVLDAMRDHVRGAQPA
ncbi:BLUF domain-containing protein [Actinomycetospora endophytica]|uniref:BLUF domain-containing protein n=1 Tax=Actinomycetospora endophytica TaxID=2291215 RepID=A0ABS8PBR9_9PSEU|nr:BLUF domain-containing protein [Actinomycetospora endophytica]MCD2195730.1 BLUF domain-containing protein [Actinomycetospora endophytica]